MRLLLLLILIPGLAYSGTLKGVGGIDSEPPDWTLFSNVIGDAGFENGTDWIINSLCERSTEQVATGSYSLKCTGSWGMNYQPNVTVGSLASQRSFKVYPGADATGMMQFNYWNSTRGVLGGGFTIYAGVGSAPYEWKGQVSAPLGEWTTLVKPDPSYTAPGMADDSWQIRINRSSATGTWYFDDAEIYPVVPLVRTFIKHPNFRGYLWSDWVQQITGVVEANAPEGGALSDYKAIVRVYKVIDGGTNTLEDTITISTFDSSEFTEGVGEFSFDATPYSIDDEILFETELQLKADDSVVSTFPAWRVVLKDTTVRDGLRFYFDHDNKLVMDGQRRFLYGPYDRFSGIRCQGCVWADKDKYVNDLLGFEGMTELESLQSTHANTSLYWAPFSGANPGYDEVAGDWSDPNTYDITLDSFNPWIDALNDYNSSHLHITNWMYDTKTLPFWGDQLTSEQMWRIFATYPKNDALLGWYVADEPELYNSLGWLTEDMVWNQTQTFKQYDPYRLHFGTLMRAWGLFRWRELLDVVSVDPYPGGRGRIAGDSLWGDITAPYWFQVTQHIDYADASSYNARPLWAVLQDFYYNGFFPTYDEMRLFAWKAIISGADGILWWAWASTMGIENQYYYQNNPQAWFDYVKISDEIMDIESVLVGTDITDQVTCNNANIDYRAFTDGTDTYIMASSNSETVQSGVEFTHPSVSGGVEVYAESRTIAPNGTRFSDTFGIDYDVHVYKINSVSANSVNFTETGITNFREATGDVFFNQ